MCSLNQVQHDVTDQLQLQLMIIFIISYQLVNVKKVLITVPEGSSYLFFYQTDSPKHKNSSIIVRNDEEKLQEEAGTKFMSEDVT